MIVKEYIPPNGSTTAVHVIKDILINGKLTHAEVSVASYANESAYLNGYGMMWQTPQTVPLDALEGPIVSAIENWLVSSPDSRFEGGVVAVDRSESLKAAQDRAWEAVKVTRSLKEVGNFMYNGGSYQADKERITGAVQLAVLAKMNGSPFSETWTLTDNTTRTHDADGIIGLGIALGKFVSGIYATGRAMREQIYAATTHEELAAAKWPETLDNAA